MKQITAIIQPYRLNEVRDALYEAGIAGMTVTEVKGTGSQKGVTEMYRGVERSKDFLPKLKLVLAVDESKVDECIEAIMQAANTNSIGAGKIFVSPLEEVVRIRTGERGTDAI